MTLSNYCILLLLVFFGMEWLYFKIADHFNIIDKPNERSSHTRITLRGGGIIFPISCLVFTGITHEEVYFTLGLFLVSVISFIDDIKPVSNKLRLLFHVAGISFLFIQLQLFQSLPWYEYTALYILCIGCLNAVNFMDGINGMTGMYALSVLLPFAMICGVRQTDSLLYILLAILVFGFFNFRKKAICFAGDVGSVSMGFILIYYLLQGTYTWHPSGTHYEYILFLLLYGLDSILTILQRLASGENIFQAHRKHLYQYLANELKWPHLIVAFLYAFIQLSFNILLALHILSPHWAWIILPFGVILYVLIKYSIYKNKVAVK